MADGGGCFKSKGNSMSLFYKQNAAARFFVDQANGKVYEVVGGSAALLCWRNGVKEREKVAELPPGLDELWARGMTKTV